MPILASLYYTQGAGYAIPRPYVTRVAVGWWAHTVQAAMPNMVITEIPFGGFRLVIRLKPWVWNWSSKRFTLGDLFEDFYGLAPYPATTPIDPGPADIRYIFDDLNSQPTIAIGMIGSDGHYSYWKYPPAPPTYYAPPLPDYPPP